MQPLNSDCSSSTPPLRRSLRLQRISELNRNRAGSHAATRSRSWRLIVGLMVGSFIFAVGPSRAHGADVSVPRCTENHLVTTFTATSSALGHEGNLLRFINLGPDCTLRGYPGVEGLSVGGRVVVHARRTPRGMLGGVSSGHPGTVNLATGSTASAILEGIGVGFISGPCRRYRYVRVTPPGATTSIAFPVRYPVCDPQIHPVVPGRTGRS
jgi:Protein of unknown function (DUF4232)